MVAAAAADSRRNGNVSASQVLEREESIRALKLQVEGLEADLRGFEGLPVGLDEARRKVRALEREVQLLRDRRDGLFEGMMLVAK